MKRLFALLLAALMVASFAACSNGGRTEEPDEPAHQPTEAPLEATEEPTPEPQVDVYLHYDETVTLGNFEVAITDVQFVSQYTTYAGTIGRLHRPNASECYLRVDYSIKNIGKTSQYIPMGCMIVDYNDGYMFSQYKCYRGVSKVSTGVENTDEMKPLSAAVNCRVYFAVPLEVRDSENPVKVVVALPDGDKTAKAYFNIRPMDDEQTELVYQRGISYITTDLDYCYRAIEIFTLLGDYKDSAENVKKAKELYAVRFGEGEYLLEHISEYSTISGSEISAMIVGEWMFSFDGMYNWSFMSNGKIDDHANHDRTWKVKGDKLLITTAGKTVWECDVYQIYEGGYLLVYDLKTSTGTLHTYKTMYPME